MDLFFKRPAQKGTLLLLTALAVAYASQAVAQQQLTNGYCKSAAEWKSRSIYFLLTDRFARADGNLDSCSNHNGYCGGNFRGLMDRLDYIKNMGFDAIWISPVQEQVDINQPYHGYHAKNWFAINSKFGTEEDFQDLLTAASNAGIWVMLDLALNHMGGNREDVGGNWPFNDIKYYHHGSDCTANRCNSNDCSITNYDYSSCSEADAQNVQMCRLAGLPDIDQRNPEVQRQTEALLTQWLPKYNITGLRLDAIKHMPDWYLREWITGKTECFTLGEALFDQPGSECILSNYQTNNVVDGLLDFSMQKRLVEAFRNGGTSSMRTLAGSVEDHKRAFNDVGVNALFLDNHDAVAGGCRWLGFNSDDNLFKNALTYVFTGMGIPILYYGTEQGFNTNTADYRYDALCRKPLWEGTNYNQQHPYYMLVKKLNKVRQTCQIWKYQQDQVYVTDDVYVYRRGDMYVILTNKKGFGNGQDVKVPVSLPAKAKMCNAFFLPDGDCVSVFTENGQNYFATKLNYGEPKIFFPVDQPQSSCGSYSPTVAM